MMLAVALNLAGLLAALPTTAATDDAVSPAAVTSELALTEAEQWETRYEKRLAKVLGDHWRVAVVFEQSTEAATVILHQVDANDGDILTHAAVEELVAAILPDSPDNQRHQVVFANTPEFAASATTDEPGWLQTLMQIAMVSLSLILMTLTFVTTQAIWSLRSDRDVAGQQASEPLSEGVEVDVQPTRTAA
ncbi:MAG: hypothetical protein NXI22_16470 [bacterium]|nr:hypothetical protein [bacterium]